MNINDKDNNQIDTITSVPTEGGDATNASPFKKRAFLEAFELNTGNVSEACNAIHINRSTFYRWCDVDPDFRQAVDDVREGLLDMTEGELLKLIKKGDVTAIIFYLKTKGKKRGYIERMEQDLLMTPADFVEQSIQYERDNKTER